MGKCQSQLCNHSNPNPNIETIWDKLMLEFNRALQSERWNYGFPIQIIENYYDRLKAKKSSDFHTQQARDLILNRKKLSEKSRFLDKASIELEQSLQLDEKNSLYQFQHIYDILLDEGKSQKANYAEKSLRSSSSYQQNSTNNSLKKDDDEERLLIIFQAIVKIDYYFYYLLQTWIKVISKEQEFGDSPSFYGMVRFICDIIASLAFSMYFDEKPPFQKSLFLASLYQMTQCFVYNHRMIKTQCNKFYNLGDVEIEAKQKEIRQLNKLRAPIEKYFALETGLYNRAFVGQTIIDQDQRAQILEDYLRENVSDYGNLQHQLNFVIGHNHYLEKLDSASFYKIELMNTINKRFIECKQL